MRRLFSASTEALIIVILVFGLLAVPVLAAKGGGGGGGGGKPAGGGSGSLSLVMVTDANADGLPNAGDTVTFNVTSSADRPYVSVNCYQGGSWVYSASAGFFAAYPWSRDFILSATSWPGGAADCTAMLYTTRDGIRINTLATVSFAAGA